MSEFIPDEHEAKCLRLATSILAHLVDVIAASRRDYVVAALSMTLLQASPPPFHPQSPCIDATHLKKNKHFLTFDIGFALHPLNGVTG